MSLTVKNHLKHLLMPEVYWIQHGINRSLKSFMLSHLSPTPIAFY